MISQSSKQGIRNPWVLGFAAIVLSGVLVNVYLVWNVMHNPVRLLDDAYSVKNHNKAEAKWVQQQAARNALGWQARLHFPQQIQGGGQQNQRKTADLRQHQNPDQGANHPGRQQKRIGMTVGVVTHRFKREHGHDVFPALFRAARVSPATR